VADIRAAVPGDLEACAGLIVRHEGGEPTRWRNAFANYLATPDHCSLVAVQNELVIGYGRSQHCDADAVEARPSLPAGWYLSGLVVSEDHRREGIGIALCKARIAWVAARAADVWFFTNVQNVRSRELHRRAGFREVAHFQSTEIDGGQGVLGHRPTSQQ
jgi:ribosomal protein S18 acetylase RimI-like enzyme